MFAGLSAAQSPAADSCADVQGFSDARETGIQDVGVRGVRAPIRIAGLDGGLHNSVATIDMFVALDAHKRGAHMSRFLELVGGGVEIGPEGPGPLAVAMVQRLEAEEGRIELSFPYFLEKPAPVTGATAAMEYGVHLSARVVEGDVKTGLTVVVPVTSLCPCSKAISRHGAHSQRSHVMVEVWGEPVPAIEEVIALVEAEASCAIHPLLKRVDEKYVTERAYDNPKFVEDMVRDVAGRLRRDRRVRSFVVSCENFESIHSHSAYARICHGEVGT